MAVIGALGNLLTLLAIPWAQSNRILGFNRTPLKYTTIFIVNLAFADFLYCITSLPMYSYTVKIFKAGIIVNIFGHCSISRGVGRLIIGPALDSQLSDISMLLLPGWLLALWLLAGNGSKIS